MKKLFLLMLLSPLMFLASCSDDDNKVGKAQFTSDKAVLGEWELVSKGCEIVNNPLLPSETNEIILAEEKMNPNDVEYRVFEDENLYIHYGTNDGVDYKYSFKYIANEGQLSVYHGSTYVSLYSLNDGKLVIAMDRTKEYADKYKIDLSEDSPTKSFKVTTTETYEVAK